MIPFEKALEIVLKTTGDPTTGSSEKVDLLHSYKRVLSKDVHSKVQHPKHPRSMMDGYAVSTEFLQPPQYEYEVGGCVGAGSGKIGKLGKGKIAYIATGACLPEGSDAVVKIEDTEKTKEGKVKILVGGVKKWMHVRKPGCDIGDKDLLLSKGTVVGGEEIGILIQGGVEKLDVVKTGVKVAVLSSGNEIVEWDDKTTGKVRDCNRLMLMFELRKLGVEVIDMGIIGDNKEELKKKLELIVQEVDVVITSGAVSMGEFDYIKIILREIATVHFEKVAMKPGKPLHFASLLSGSQHKYIFGLPGNPVSAFIAFKLIVLPCLWKLLGFNKPYYPTIPLKIVERVKKNKEREQFVRAKISWHKSNFVAISTGNQNSSRILSLRDMNGVIRIPKGDGVIQPGQIVSGFLFDELKIYDKVEVEQKKETIIRSCGCDGHIDEKSTLEKREREHFSELMTKKENIRFGVLTVSDRAFKKVYTDESGPEIIKILQSSSSKWKVERFSCVPDEEEIISKTLTKWVDSDDLHLILTTGGTGFSPRDVTPEATKKILEKETPSIIHGIQSICAKDVPMAILSRAVAGIRKKTLIINMPGKTKAVRENLSVLLKARIDHAIKLMRK